MPVTVRRERDVSVVTFENPPVNALSARKGLIDELARAIRAEAESGPVRALVIRGAGRCFSAGTDIADFGDSPDEDVAEVRALNDLLDSIEKPVVMALHGVVLGGGLELALAGHYRIAEPGARLGFPEVSLGLLPGGGGTQRSVRLVGAQKALELMLSGKPVGAEAALAMGLIDRIADGDLEAAAIEMARDHAASAQTRRARDLAPSDDVGEAVAAARRTLDAKGGRGLARAKIIDCVEAAGTRPFEEGLQLEYRHFGELMVSEPSRGLRHAFLGERIAGRIPDLPAGVTSKALDNAVVIGAGTMGVGITVALLNAGFTVTLIEQNGEALARGETRIRKIIEGDAEKRRITPEEAARRLGRLTPALDLAAVGNADIVIEAVFEDLSVKKQVFEKLDLLASEGAILASNTSTLNVDTIAAFTKRPERVVGLHFFSPAHIMRLLEVVRGERTAPDVLATAMSFARRIGKVGVVARVCDGFIGNRIFEEYLRQAYFLLEEGALPQQIDAALERFGMAMGPLRVMDLAGQDIGWSIRKRRAVEQPDRPYSKLPDLICEMGRFGQKTGAGWYLYPQGSRGAAVDPEIDALVLRHSEELGIRRRDISDEEIVSRCLLAMVNEGAKIVEEKIAYRPVDIDVVYVNGYGFSAERGGPMFYADRQGLPRVLEEIRRFGSGYQGWAWEPAPLLVDLVRRGASFASLNAA